MAVCSRCGKDVGPDPMVCIHCGKEQTGEPAGVKCPKCSTRNPPDAVQCKVCRSSLLPSDAKRPAMAVPAAMPKTTVRPQTAPSVAVPKPAPKVVPRPTPKPELTPEPVRAAVKPAVIQICRWCGEQLTTPSRVCPHCHRDMVTGTFDTPQEFAPPDYREYEFSADLRTVPQSSPMFLAGILLMIGGVLALGQGLVYMVTNDSIGGIGLSVIDANCCGGIVVILAFCAMIGGSFAIQRKRWMLVLLSSAALFFTFAFFVVGPLMGIAAFLLVWDARFEFESE